MDYYQCEKCGRVFDEFRMNFKYASENGKCLCEKCIKQEKEDYESYLSSSKLIIKENEI
jgi:formylmethanofuran dehydrogenase subunit E